MRNITELPACDICHNSVNPCFITHSDHNPYRQVTKNIWQKILRGNAGFADQTAILAGVLPLKSADQAKELTETHTEFVILETVISRLMNAGNAQAQEKEGVKIAAEIMTKLKSLSGLRGIHICSGGNEKRVGQLLAAVS